MEGTSTIIAVYSAQAAELFAAYEALDAEPFRQTYADLLPAGGPDRLALDVGAGSGRDASWLVSLGYDVVAAEPAAGLREKARLLRPDSPLRWIDDRLPALPRCHQLGLAYDVILLSAVWQHVAPWDRRRAFRKLTALLKPKGLLVIILRFGPSPPDRPMHEVSVGEIEALAREHGLAVTRTTTPMADGAGRADVNWVTMCLTLPDDGAGALPLLRGIILNDAKTTTYKLGLLRSIARLADLAPALARPGDGQDDVVLPLGAVALNWLRMYLPLIAAGIPQSPSNSGPDGLGFVGDAFRGLLASGIAPTDLRIGASFGGDRAVLVSKAIGDAARTIVRMPANFTTYPGTEAQVFQAHTNRVSRGQGLVLDGKTLALFGSITVPGHVWRAMQRLGAWIEPVLVAEWARLTRSYAAGQGRTLQPGVLEATLAWVEPSRDVKVARDIALSSMGAGEQLNCVWSGQRLRPYTLDIDHCLPWSAWACGDLWNLFPAHRRINQHQKRDRLPSGSALANARPRILEWWEDAWERQPHLAHRFRHEASATLNVPAEARLEEVFEALEWRRLRLRQDQQLMEWPAINVGVS